MAKIRVHELAKEEGYAQSRDLLEKLQKLGFDVKSHASTVDDDEARSALKKDEEEKKAATVEKQISSRVIRRRPKSAVIRRRASDADDIGGDEEAGEVEAAPEEAAPAPAAVVESEPAEPIVEPVAEPPAVVAAGEPVVVATPEAPVPEAPVATAAEPAVEVEDEEARARREGKLARPEVKRREDEADEEDEKPEMSMEDFGFSETDFTSSAKAEENTVARVAPPPPSRKPAVMQREEEPASKVVRRIDPAVLKARLASAKRPEPPKEWGKPEIPASPVTELVVRTDASGKKREFVDVRKEAARAKRAGGHKRREEMSAKDLLEHRRGQVFYPTPQRRRVKGKKVPRRPDSMAPVSKKPVDIGETITVADLAKAMSIKAGQVLTWLMRNGVHVPHLNAPLDHETAAMVAAEYGYEVRSQVFDEEARLAGTALDDIEANEDPDAEPRAPVVTVMGHVDHGKTSLLDRIRKTNVAAGEAGGITQAIAGYQVPTSRGLITFLDTPGHKAFTAMRARGANITDIVVLVVAADDGVMPQTEEAIQHAKAAEVPIIVAVNKVDKPEANPQKVLQQLASYGVMVEEWGGDVQSRQVSAKTGQGVEELLEALALQAEIMELRANPKVPAVGRVIEAEIDKGRGPVATVLILEGTLRVGDAVIAGEALGKVRAMMDDTGKRIKQAGPSVPVQILGLDSAPSPGDEMRVAHSLEDARKIASHRREVRRDVELAGRAKVSLQDFLARMNAGESKELRLIIKADVQGSVEALRNSLEQLTNNQVRVNVIHGGVGAIVEGDVEFARASDAIIIGFNVRPDTKALKASRSLGGVDIRTHSIIYECVDEVRLAMQGLLAPVAREKYLGRAEIRQTFTVPRVGTVAGCAIIDGVVSRSAQIRVLRDSKQIYEGRLSSLKRFKDDVREVKEGFECGMGVERFNDLKIGDVIEAFEIEQVAAVLDDSKGSEVRI